MSKKKKSQMKEWSEEKDELIHPEFLLSPLFEIAYQGYSFERKAITQFKYKGFNIGKEELISSPTPEERFSSRWLENEAKHDRTLIENIITTAFQLGMEQGRRHERKVQGNVDLIKDLLLARSRRIKDLRSKLSAFDPSFKEEKPISLYTSDPDVIIENCCLEDPSPSKIIAEDHKLDKLIPSVNGKLWKNKNSQLPLR